MGWRVRKVGGGWVAGVRGGGGGGGQTTTR